MAVVLVAMKKVQVSIGDWTNVVKKRRIRQNVSERAAGHRTIQFRGRARDDIWEALKQLPFEEEKSKKRGREDDSGVDDEDAARVKRIDKKKAPAADLDFTDLL
jgi:hypothetical protein